MQNVLVTGGAGFIGSNFVRFLLHNEPAITIVNLDVLTYAGRLENISDLEIDERYHFVRGNICNIKIVSEIFHQYHIDTVVNFAAETHVDRSIKNPGQFIQTNIVGTYTLLEAARRAWLGEKTVPLAQARFHQISTDEVFGSLNPGEPAWNELSPYAPNSPYSASKASSDHLVRAYSQTYGLPSSITNCSNNYGPYQFPEKMIPLAILNALEGKPIPIYGDGNQVRDWLYVEDHCAAIHQVIKKGGIGDTYAVGGDNQTRNLELVNMICEILDEIMPDSENTPHSSLVVHVPDRPGHDRRYAMDMQRINAELGWRPQYSLYDGLQKTIHWYLDHQEWIRQIKKNTDFKSWLVMNYSDRGKK